MSYILDALRKSEQQRLAGGVPGLNSGQAAVLETATPQRNWMGPAILLLALNAGAIAWWLATRSGAPAHPPAPTPATPQPAVRPPVAQAPASPTPTRAPVQAPTPAVVPAEAPAAISTPPQTRDRPRQDQPPAARPSRPEAPTAAAAPPTEADAIPPAPPRGGIVAYADLPPSVKKSLPPLQVSGYIDGAGEAMLVVDDRLVHEGDEIGPGVRLLKISPEGAVFSFRNYRFRR